MPILVVQSSAGSIQAQVEPGDDRVLADILASAGVPLNTRCGKRGVCRGCVVELKHGAVTGAAGRVAAPASVRSCLVRLEHATAEVTVEVPAHARLEAMPQVSDSFATDVPVVLDPAWPVIRGQSDLAIAVDVGTTTVAVALLDLLTGDVLSRAGDFNAQIRFGDNVLTRIVAAADRETLAQLQKAVFVETVLPLVQRVCALADRPADRLAGCMVAANTTMLHLLTGEDPTGLGVVPFTPRFLQSRTILVRDLMGATNPVTLSPELPVTLLPGFAAYVGADLAAGVYASGMMLDDAPSLLVDIGTNGEIVLQAGGRLFGCATAAGPAFEGAGLLAGTRAQAGAISHLEVQPGTFGFDIETIDQGEPADAPGLCGTAYIDFLATARAAGLLLPSGRFEPGAWNNLPQDRRAEPVGGRTLRIAGALRISEADIAQLLQAKAAIGAGIETLLAAAGVRACDVGRLHLAGGFGLFIDVPHAIETGLLPGFRPDQIRVVGNSSLAGAVLAALDKAVLLQIERLRERMQIIELNRERGFEDCYLDHLCLP